MVTPVIETERLILRPLKVADAKDAFERWTTDPEVTKFMRYSVHQSIADTKEWLKMEEANNLTDKGYGWGFVLKENNYLFGSGGFVYQESEECFELGYNTMRK